MTNLLSRPATDLQNRRLESPSRFNPQHQPPSSGTPTRSGEIRARTVSEPARIIALAACSEGEDCFYCACPETD